jgi:hypothetical protein
MPEALPTVGLVGCARRKLARAAPATELYTSPLFRLASRFCAATCNCWFILSARHGLLEPTQVIEPYDATLHGLSRAEKDAWARGVAAQLRERDLLDGRHRLLLHAGAAYADPLAPHLTAEQPLRGLTIGRRVAWYRRHLATLSERNSS